MRIFILVILGTPFLVLIFFIQQEFFPVNFIDFSRDVTASPDFICRSVRYDMIHEGDSEKYVNYILGNPRYVESDGGTVYFLKRREGTIVLYFNQDRKIYRKSCGFG